MIPRFAAELVTYVVLVCACPQDGDRTVDSGLRVVGDDGAPLQGVEVEYGSRAYLLGQLGYGGPPEGSHGVSLTDAQGRFRIIESVAEQGLALVELSHPEWCQVHHVDGRQSYAAGAELLMLPAEPLDVHVLDPDGEPVGGARVFVTVSNGPYRARNQEYSDADGIARLGLLPHGALELEARRPSSRPDLVERVEVSVRALEGSAPTVRFAHGPAPRGTWSCTARQAVGGAAVPIEDASLKWLGSSMPFGNGVEVVLENGGVRAELVHGEPYELRVEADGLAPFRRVFEFDAAQGSRPFVAEMQPFSSLTLEFEAPLFDVPEDEVLVVRHARTKHRMDTRIGGHWSLEPKSDLHRNQDVSRLLERRLVSLGALQPGLWRISRPVFREGWIADPLFVEFEPGSSTRQLVRYVPGVAVTLQAERPAGSAAKLVVDIVDSEGRLVLQDITGTFHFAGLDQLPPIERRLLPDVYEVRANWTDPELTPSTWTTQVSVDARRGDPGIVLIPHQQP